MRVKVRLLGLLVAAALVAGLVSFVAGPASAYPFATVDLVGHGWGHGRGMGQYGAYGYAQAGQSGSWILDHYYGGTTTATMSATMPVNVHLSAFDGADTLTQMTNGHLAVSWTGGSLSSQAGVRVVHNAGGTLTVFTGPSCAGPWTMVAANLAGTDVTISPQLPGDNIAEMVQACLPDGSVHWYRGNIVARSGSGQTWNALGLDQYVRGVVPAESPASWGASGGEEALKAQAVAARSYGLSYFQANGAICDTTACQSYGGRAVLPKGGSFRDLEGAGIFLTTTDAAVSSTAGQVRICTGSPGCPAGTVAHTEYSSSTGGYSAGGTFPAVVDAGDATPSNPNHTWTAGIPVASVQGAFPSIGVLQRLAVTQRNGLGDLGGRVLQIAVSGSSGTVRVTGDQFAADFGLRSDWFAVTNAVTGPSGGDNGYSLVAADGGVFAFGAAPFLGSTGGLALAQPIVGMAPTPDQAGYWFVASDGGIFAFGDAGFHGSTGGVRLNRPVRAMAATQSGRGYWLVAADGGIFAFGDAGFHGSTGGVTLNQPVVGMAATPTGHGYWLVASDGGIFAFGDAGFYGSTGGIRLSQPIVGMVPTPDGRGYLLVGRDGGIFAFGDARFFGSLSGRGVTAAIVAVQPTADGGGYLMVSAAGAVYSFGDAPWFGDLATLVPNYGGQVVGLTAHRGT
jgi:SpoIID/LytB domain protein